MKFVKTDDGKRGMVQAMDGLTEAGAMTFTWAGTEKLLLIIHT